LKIINCEKLSKTNHKNIFLYMDCEKLSCLIHLCHLPSAISREKEWAEMESKKKYSAKRKTKEEMKIVNRAVSKY
jgi:hypothetical protein